VSAPVRIAVKVAASTIATGMPVLAS